MRRLMPLVFYTVFSTVSWAVDGENVARLYGKIGPAPATSEDTSTVRAGKVVQHLAVSPVMMIASPFMGFSDGFSGGLTDLATAENGANRLKEGLLILPKTLAKGGTYLVRTGYAVVKTPIEENDALRARTSANVVGRSSQAGISKPMASMVTEAQVPVAPITGASAINNTKSNYSLPVYSLEAPLSGRSAWQRSFGELSISRGR